MAATPRKIIAIVGATGRQGSSVARVFLSLPGWHVRAITRTPSSDKARALQSQGAELMQADLTDILSLIGAFANANAIFVNTSFWPTYRALEGSGLPMPTRSRIAYEAELFHGKNSAIAAAGTPTLERFIYSYLPSPGEASNGKYHRSLHLESKWSVVKYIRAEEPELAKKMSLICLGAYHDNRLLSPQKDPSTHKYVFKTALDPKVKIPIINPEEATGLFVRSLVEDEQAGTSLLAYNRDSILPMEEVFRTWSSITGQPVQYVHATTEQLHHEMKLPWEVLDSLDAMNEFGYTNIKGIQPNQLKNPPVTTSWKDWLHTKGARELLDRQ